MSTKCTQCQSPASVVFSWCASMGPQRAPLCDKHAQWWHDTYKHTPAGQSLTITPVAKDAA